jgi:hypothetical protein
MVRAVTPIPFVKARFFDRCGKPLTGGKIYTYEANTTTPKVTYKDPYGLTPNTNPIILDAAGEADIYLDGTYRIRITDRNDVLINDVSKIGSWFSDNLQDTLDNISAAMDDAIKPALQSLDETINAAAAAAANGWVDTLVFTTTGENQQQRNKRTFSILDYFTKSEFDNYKANVSTFDATNIIKRALLSADILDCNNVPLRISSPLTVRKGCKFLNLNITNLNTMISSVLVNSKTTVTGRIVGSGIGGDNIERGIFGADGDGAVTDVNLDITVSNLTVGVQVSNSDMVNTMCSRWCGILRFENLVGGGINSNGYGVLVPRASQCNFIVFANNVPRHDVYLSAGSVDNDIVCHSNNNKGSPLSMASYANQEYTTQNRVTMYINNCTPQSSSSKFAAVITGKTKHNDIYLYGRNSPTLNGALVFRSLAADATCHGNYAHINWVGGSSSNLVSNEASFNNEFDIVGSGGIVGSSGGALLSATDYNGITGYSDGVPRFTARIKSLNWDAAKTEAGHSPYSYALIQGLAWADMDIGEGVLKGAKGFAVRKVALYAANILGTTHRERIKTTTQTIAANTSVTTTITYKEEFSNISIPLITAVVLDSVFVNTVTATIVSQNAAGCIIRISNSGASAQQVIIVGEVSGY